jgi:hypothetical protein
MQIIHNLHNQITDHLKSIGNARPEHSTCPVGMTRRNYDNQLRFSAPKPPGPQGEGVEIAQ